MRMNSIFTLVGWASATNHDDYLKELERVSIDDLMGSGDLIRYIDDLLLEAPANLVKRVMRYSDVYCNARTSYEDLNNLILN